jgi:hypothetical protein
MGFPPPATMAHRHIPQMLCQERQLDREDSYFSVMIEVMGFLWFALLGLGRGIRRIFPVRTLFAMVAEFRGHERMALK